MPVDNIRAGGRVYYLGATFALIDANYGLYECGRLGVICRQVFRSGDTPLDSPEGAELIYDPLTNELSVDVGWNNLIFVYHPGEE